MRLFLLIALCITSLSSEAMYGRSGGSPQQPSLLFGSYQERAMTRQQAIAETVALHGDLDDLAERIGCSKNLLYRASLATNAGSDIALGKIEKLIEVTGDYRILDYLNWRFGFHKAAPPDLPANPAKIVSWIENMQIAQINASRALRRYYAERNEQNKRRADQGLLKLIELAQNMRTQIEGEWDHVEKIG